MRGKLPRNGVPGYQLNIIVLATVNVFFLRFQLKVDDVWFGLTTQFIQKAWYMQSCIGRKWLPRGIKGVIR